MVIVKVSHEIDVSLGWLPHINWLYCLPNRLGWKTTNNILLVEYVWLVRILVLMWLKILWRISKEIIVLCSSVLIFHKLVLHRLTLCRNILSLTMMLLSLEFSGLKLAIISLLLRNKMITLSIMTIISARSFLLMIAKLSLLRSKIPLILLTKSKTLIVTFRLFWNEILSSEFKFSYSIWRSFVNRWQWGDKSWSI